MTKTMDLIVFFTVSTAFILFWGRILWYCDEKSKVMRSIVYFLMRFSRFTFDQIKSMLLTVVYCSIGLGAAFFFSYWYDLGLGMIFEWNGSLVLFIGIGIMAEISFVNLLTGLFMTVRSNVNFAGEIADTPWISGIRRLPKPMIPIVPPVSGFIEEILFRGVLFLIMVEKLMLPAWLAVALITIFFIVQQILQVRTLTQALVMSMSCISISVVGCLLVLHTGSIIPAAVSHSSFVIFYFSYMRSSTPG